MKIKKSCISLACLSLGACTTFGDRQQEPLHYIPITSETQVADGSETAGSVDSNLWYEYVRFSDSKKSLPAVSGGQPQTAPIGRTILEPVIAVPKKAERDDFGYNSVQTGQNERKALSETNNRNEWLFKAEAEYTVQYTSTPLADGAERLAEEVRKTDNINARVYEVRHEGAPHYIVLGGEYSTLSEGSAAANGRDVWVRKFSVLRKNRCSSAKSLIERGVDVGEYCGEWAEEISAMYIDSCGTAKELTSRGVDLVDYCKGSA